MLSAVRMAMRRISSGHGWQKLPSHVRPVGHSLEEVHSTLQWSTFMPTGTLHLARPGPEYRHCGSVMPVVQGVLAVQEH
jgi:hypothetical protein